MRPARSRYTRRKNSASLARSESRPPARPPICSSIRRRSGKSSAATNSCANPPATRPTVSHILPDIRAIRVIRGSLLQRPSLPILLVHKLLRLRSVLDLQIGRIPLDPPPAAIRDRPQQHRLG